jgi:transcriptional regulator with XRE-family HTH domain
MSSERAQPRVRANLGARLRAMRKERGLSQEGLGVASGLSGKFIGEVERAEKSISVDSLHRVGRALEVPIAEILDFDGARPNPAIEQLLALVRKQPARMVGRVLAVVRQIVA